MRFSDEVIASYLNNEWRTPPAVHRLLDSRGECSDIAYALERLARAGQIECKHEAVMPSKGPPICVNYYRKLQRRRCLGRRSRCTSRSRTSPSAACAIVRPSPSSVAPVTPWQGCRPVARRAFRTAHRRHLHSAHCVG